MKKTAVLIGTRPGIIKMTPLVHELKKQGADHVVIHTGQHYSVNMDRDIQQDVGLEKIDYSIIRPDDCISHAEQTAYMLVEIEKALLKSRPDILLVCGDANTNFAGAVAARKIHVDVGHVEAGLRSFDWRMPEEHNRVMIDHISDFLFAPTDITRSHLVRENVNGKIFVVGNTIVDSTLKNTGRISAETRAELGRLTEGSDYILLTLHREENVDNYETFKNILVAVRAMAGKSGMKTIFPIHPRTSKRASEFGLMDELINIDGLVLIEPVNYLKMLALIKNAKLVLTDSGGLQEESCILGTPCLTLRENTERPETVDVGANRIAGTDPERIISAFADIMRAGVHKWKNPFGDGRAAKRIIDTCLNGQPEDEFTGAS